MKAKSVKRVGLHRLIEHLTDNAMMESCLHGNGEKHRPLDPADMPGYRIKQLSPEERETLSKATAKDFSWRGFK